MKVKVNRVITPEGPGILINTNHSIFAGGEEMVRVVTAEGSRLFSKSSIKPETLRMFLLRDTGFGKTSWPAFIGTQAILACFPAIGMWDAVPTVGWSIWGFVNSVYVYMHIHNYKYN